MTRPGIEPQSPMALANILLIRPSASKRNITGLNFVFLFNHGMVTVYQLPYQG